MRRSLKKFNVPTRADVDRKSKKLFDKLKRDRGSIPNIYAFIGHSSHALKGYLDMEKQMEKGNFRAKERQAINLAISEYNGCKYCVDAHNYLAQQHGFSAEECMQIRKLEHPDPKINVLTELAVEIQKTNGGPDEDYLIGFFRRGYDVAALVDLIALVSMNAMTNYVYRTTGFQIDFPSAPELED